MNERTIFLEALEKELPEERQAFLDQACGDNPAIRHEVELLLKAHERAGDFLENTPAGIQAPATILHPVTERAGDSIGPYKLLQQIGEGGMGVVYMAEQTKPIERRVALKIIKPGMDTRQVIARFEAERQALAMMDHPNIAKVLDAGVTETGRPYFVMELVKGAPITEYCDEHKISTSERLKLLIPACQAIQHAHQKGIIHRDIKPSNVLVAHYDDLPVPKVIDFGVAKAIDHRLTEKTMFTAFGQVLGTFEYMSPEQARFNQIDVDTRTDVYSLGVLLYELLSGATPFDGQRLRSEAIDEIFRIIREEEPPKPSTRISTSQSLPTIATNRRTDPKELNAIIHGELDWIVMKALDKDRTQRYESANSLAADLERHLNDEPVTAGPPLARYRLAKFVKRNKLQVIAGTAVIAALVVALVGTSLGMIWAWREQARADDQSRRATAAAQKESEARVQAQENAERAVSQKKIAERELARATEIKELITQMLQSVDPRVAQGADTTLLRGILDDAAGRLAGGEITDELVAAELHHLLGFVLITLGEATQSEKHYAAAADLRKRVLGLESPNTHRSLLGLAGAYGRQRRWAEAEQLSEKAFQSLARVLGPEDPMTLFAMSRIAWIHQNQGRLEDAEPLHGKILEVRMRVLGPEHSDTAFALSGLANVRWHMGRLHEAAGIYEKAIEVHKRELGAHHPSTLSEQALLALVYRDLGRFDDAKALLKQVSEGRTKVLGPNHEDTLETFTFLTEVHIVQASRHPSTEDFDHAAAEWLAVLKHAKDDALWSSQLKRVCLIIASRPQVFQRVAELMPAVTTLWIGRGQYHAQRSQWKLAANDYARGFESRSLNDESLVSYAGTLLLTGDEHGYEQLCAKLSARVADPESTFDSFVAARTGSLGPVSHIAPDQLVDWAAERLTHSTAPWEHHVMGLAQYRAGRYDDAMDSLKASNAGLWGGRNGPHDALNWVVLALCHGQIGQPEQARQCYDKATTLIKLVTPEEGEPTTMPPLDWVEWHVLLRQAKSSLKIVTGQLEPQDSS